ncbi:cell wall glycosyl hydrolase YteR [Poronia punctata]|nr:cell wall glycosyl hydrolase YteR [Poronia punctata]
MGRVVWLVIPNSRHSTIMQLLLLQLAAGAAASVTTPLVMMADSFIKRGVPSTINYSQMTLYMGFEAAYNLTGDVKYDDWHQEQIDQLVKSDGTIKDWDYDYYSLDDYRMGNNLLYWYAKTGETKYKEAASIIRQQINRHPRTPAGGLWHRSPIYADQMWLDGIFMADSFYAKWTSVFDRDNETAWDDIALQYANIEAHTRNKTTGLLRHGYDESKEAVWADPETGSAPLVWDRAVGWYFLSLLEVLEVWPKTHAARGKLVGYLETLAVALKKTQDESGGWWLIMSDPYPGAKGNYIESSGSAMFTYGFLKGIRQGLLSEDEYLAAAQKAYEFLADEFVVDNGDGTVDWTGTVEVGSLNSNGTYEYYISVPLAVNDYKGAGPFMLASYEMEML